MTDIYERIHAAVLMRKSPEQREKWRGQRDRALAKFIDVIGGDKRIVELTAEDVDRFTDHLETASF